jgi:hypothetical protein
LKVCAGIMGKEMGWEKDREAAEMAAAKEQFQGPAR